jgi:MFS family permease
MPKAPSSLATPTTLWRHKPFLLFWTGGAVSDVGSAVSTLVLPLLAVETLRATTFQVSMIGMLGRLPFLLLTLPAGVLVDRMRRRTLMIWSDVGSMIALGSIPLISLFGHVVLWQVYVAILATACLRVVFDVADLSYLPTLLTREQLVDGNGKLRATETFADSIGPTLGAGLASLIGAARAVAADSFSFAISVLSLCLIRVREAGPEPVPAAARVGFREAMKVGLRFVLGNAILRKIAACTATANLAISLVTSIEVVFLLRTLHASPAQVGLVLGLGTMGGFAGSLVARRLAERVGTARIMWVALVVPAPLTFLMPLAGHGWGSLTYAAGWAAFNAAGAVYNTAQVSYRQSACPPELLGRVNASLRWLIYSTTPVGALLGGTVGTWLGLRTTLWIGATIMSLTGLWLLASPLRGLRDIPLPAAQA